MKIGEVSKYYALTLTNNMREIENPSQAKLLVIGISDSHSLALD